MQIILLIKTTGKIGVIGVSVLQCACLENKLGREDDFAQMNTK